MSYFFVGSFSIPQAPGFKGSAAGAKVQHEIINALESQFGKGQNFVMPELPSWPNEKLLVRSNYEGRIHFLPTFNFYLLKRLFFFVFLFFYFVRNRPNFIFFYNTSLSCQLFSLLVRPFSCRTILILQDINCRCVFGTYLLVNPKELLCFISSKFVRFSFDFYVPITEVCVRDFKLPDQKCYVFPGGIIESSIEGELFCVKESGEKYSVFAGSIEPYNGIDLLVNSWPFPETREHRLHVFGRGSLDFFVRQVAAQNKNIIFHGFASPEIVNYYSRFAQCNFCLRYSKGIDQRYFFPSKFFDLIVLSGALVCNRFDNIPEDLRPYVTFVDEDLANLLEALDWDGSHSETTYVEKMKILKRKYTWKRLVEEVDSRI